jgi:hypothetical protein
MCKILLLAFYLEQRGQEHPEHGTQVDGRGAKQTRHTALPSGALQINQSIMKPTARPSGALKISQSIMKPTARPSGALHINQSVTKPSTQPASPAHRKSISQ